MAITTYKCSLWSIWMSIVIFGSVLIWNFNVPYTIEKLKHTTRRFTIKEKFNFSRQSFPTTFINREHENTEAVGWKANLYTSIHRNRGNNLKEIPLHNNDTSPISARHFDMGKSSPSYLFDLQKGIPNTHPKGNNQTVTL